MEYINCLINAEIVKAKLICDVEPVSGADAKKVEHGGYRYIVIKIDGKWKRYTKIHQSDPEY